MNSVSSFFQQRIPRFFLGMVLLGVIVVTCWYSILKYTEYSISRVQRERESLNMKIHTTIVSGQYAEAVSSYDALIAQTSNLSVRRSYELQKEIARFYSGGTENREHALRAMSAIAGNTSYDVLVRASAVRALLDAYFSDYNSKTLDFILSQEPFISNTAIVKTDARLAVRQIAEFGITLYPLSSLQVAEGGWYASAILENRNDPKKIQEYREMLGLLIERARVQETKERKAISEITRMRFLNGIGFLEGVLQIDAVKKNDAYENTFQEALRLASMHPDTLPVKDSALYTRLNYARILYRLYGDYKKNDITILLNDLSKEYKSVKEPEKLSFRAFITNDELRLETNTNYLHTVFVNFSAFSTEFKALLQQNGWKL